MTSAVQQAGAQPVEVWKIEKPDAAFAALDNNESLADGIGASYAVIGYKGKIWSIRHRGEKKLLLRPDDGTPAGYIDVVILRAAPNKAKSYYPHGFDEDTSTGVRPACASIDGVHPDPDVQDKQADVCALCPQNVWYVDENGKKKRNCTDYKRLAVFLMPDQTAKLFGSPILEPAFLRVPPDSLNDLATFGNNLQSQGWPYSSFVTRITFDSTKSHPKFVFKFLHKLTKDDAPFIIEMREDMLAKRITGEDEIGKRLLLTNQTKEALAAPAQSIGLAPKPAQAVQGQQASPPVPPQPAPLPPNPPAVEALPNPSIVGSLGKITRQEDPEPPTQRTVPIMIEGTATVSGPAIPPSAMIGQTADDTGAGAEDTELDAKIQAMFAS